MDKAEGNSGRRRDGWQHRVFGYNKSGLRPLATLDRVSYNAGLTEPKPVWLPLADDLPTATPRLRQGAAGKIGGVDLQPPKHSRAMRRRRAGEPHPARPGPRGRSGGMADAPDSKSGQGNLVWVRLPPPVLFRVKGLVACGRESFCRGGRRLSRALSLRSQFCDSILRKSRGPRGCAPRGLSRELSR